MVRGEISSRRRNQAVQRWKSACATAYRRRGYAEFGGQSRPGSICNLKAVWGAPLLSESVRIVIQKIGKPKSSSHKDDHKLTTDMKLLCTTFSVICYRSHPQMPVQRLKSMFAVAMITLGLNLSPVFADSIPQLVAKTKPATIQIMAFDENWSPVKTGTGFFISPDGLTVTNYHVIQGASHLSGRTNEGATFQVPEGLEMNII